MMARRGNVIVMFFYATRTGDGLVHVQNSVMGMLGQHHVHSENGYKEWRKQISPDVLTEDKAEKCDCGLGVREVREYDGQEWKGEKY